VNATICPRCGGHATRCECAELRREGMLMARNLLSCGQDTENEVIAIIASGPLGMPLTVAGAITATLGAVDALLSDLARKPEPL
jgi:hypothetical protein